MARSRLRKKAREIKKGTGILEGLETKECTEQSVHSEGEKCNTVENKEVYKQENFIV